MIVHHGDAIAITVDNITFPGSDIKSRAGGIDQSGVRLCHWLLSKSRRRTGRPRQQRKHDSYAHANGCRNRQTAYPCYTITWVWSEILHFDSQVSVIALLRDK